MPGLLARIQKKGIVPNIYIIQYSKSCERRPWDLLSSVKCKQISSTLHESFERALLNVKHFRFARTQRENNMEDIHSGMHYAGKYSQFHINLFIKKTIPVHVKLSSQSIKQEVKYTADKPNN